MPAKQPGITAEGPPPWKVTFVESDIDLKQPGKLAQMRSMVLHRQGSEDVVVPVLHPTHNHFRQLGNGFRELPLPRTADPDPTHDDCVRDILNRASQKPLPVRVITLVFNEVDSTGDENNGVHSQASHTPQTIVKSTSRYAWFREKDARIRFADQRYIQPDLAARSFSSLTGSGAEPTILIEVIRTHLPEEETWKRLEDLSKTAHIVVFYFIPSGHLESQFNSVRVFDNIISVRATAYLLNGKLFVRGCQKSVGGDAATRYQEAMIVLTPFKDYARKPKGTET